MAKSKSLVLITAHQNRRKGTNYHNTQALKKAAQKQGYAVQEFEVFDFPVIKEHPLDAPFPKEFDAPVQALLEAEQIVFVTPMWNFNVPWALKNFLDGAIQAKKLFSFLPAPWWKEKLGIGEYEGYLTAKRVHIIWTSGGPSKLLTLVGMNLLVKQIKLTMKFCGIKRFKTLSQGGIRQFDEKKYARWIQKLENYKF